MLKDLFWNLGVKRPILCIIVSVLFVGSYLILINILEIPSYIEIKCQVQHEGDNIWIKGLDIDTYIEGDTILIQKNKNTPVVWKVIKKKENNMVLVSDDEIGVVNTEILVLLDDGTRKMRDLIYED